MDTNRNELGQPIGFPIAGWKGCPQPTREAMQGRYCRLEPLDVDLHAKGLYEAYMLDQEGRTWTYLAVGPFTSFEEYREHLIQNCLGEDPLFFTILDQMSGRAVGVASYLRIARSNGTIEVGSLTYSPLMQRTPISTEAMYLMMARAFDELGYRRYEWKCDSLNQPSRDAALRLGFQFEGIFRQANVYKGRNRDTAWFSILDTEWPKLKEAFERWLSPSNFDAEGKQVKRLLDCFLA